MILTVKIETNNSLSLTCCLRKISSFFLNLFIWDKGSISLLLNRELTKFRGTQSKIIWLRKVVLKFRFLDVPKQGINCQRAVERKQLVKDQIV